MTNKLFVGGLPYETTQDELTRLFAACGKVNSVKIIIDRETGRSKGFGFVEMSTEAEAQAALQKLNGTTLGTRQIFINEARPPEKRPPGFVRPGGPSRPGGAPGGAAPDKPWGDKPGWSPDKGGDRRGSKPGGRKWNPKKRSGKHDAYADGGGGEYDAKRRNEKLQEYFDDE